MIRLPRRTLALCGAVLFAALSPYLRAAANAQPALEQLEVLGIDPRSDAFARAVALKQARIIDLFLKAEVSPNLPDASGRTPLFYAVQNGDEKLASRLLTAGADPNLAGADRVSPLMLAAALGEPPILEALLKAGANVQAVDQEGRNPLYYAIKARKLPVVERLLQGQTRIGMQPGDENQALSLAAETRDWRFIQPILDRVEHRAWDFSGRSLLQQAVEASDVAKVRLVLSKHEGPPTPENCKEPLLAYAVAAHDVKMTRLLLEAGADANTTVNTPAEARFLEYTAPKFLKHYLSEEPGMTVLMIAAGQGYDDLVHLLIEKGADRFRATRSKYKLIPLYFAAWGEHAECLQTLIGNAPSPDQMRIEVSLASQRATLYRDNSAIYNTEISSGRKGFSTPTGRFVVTDKKSVHVSTIYKVKMPFFMRLSCRDFGMHEGVVPNYPASHGCIRLPGDAARRLFKEVPIGTLVTITN